MRTADSPLVFVVDDNEPMRGLLTQLLRGHGLRVETFSDGTSAVRAFEQRVMDKDGPLPDCIIMNYFMPGMDGCEACRAIRLLEKLAELPRMPIVLTSACFKESENCAQGREFDVFLQTPFSIKPFLELMDELLHLPLHGKARA
jgi:CheY-like chemotaxis protein